MSEDNPSIEELEESISSNSTGEKHNPVADIASAIETILSEEHIDQKTIISYEQEEGLIGLDVIQAHFYKSFNYTFPSLTALKDSKQEHAISVLGKGREQIVDIMRSLQPQIISSDGSNLTSRLLGRR